MARRIVRYLGLGSLIIVSLACLSAAALIAAEPVWLFPPAVQPTEPPPVAKWITPLANFTVTPTFPPPTPTPTPFPVSPSPTMTPAEPPPTATPTWSPSPAPTAAAAPAAATTPAPPPVDFVVVQQRMRTNEENSWDGKVANNCGGDHSIYVQVIDAAGRPLPDIMVGDTYGNVRASSGTAGPGRLQIQLWSNTMSLEVQGNIDGTPYTSEQTVPLSTRDEDIPTEWLLAGGYCESMDDCRLRQQTNGLCRGHYSFDVTFQRTW